VYAYQSLNEIGVWIDLKKIFSEKSYLLWPPLCCHALTAILFFALSILLLIGLVAVIVIAISHPRRSAVVKDDLKAPLPIASSIGGCLTILPLIEAPMQADALVVAGKAPRALLMPLLVLEGGKKTR
jgi:hypothetical protein